MSVSTPGRLGPASTNLAPFHRSISTFERSAWPTAKQVFVPAHATSRSSPPPLDGVALGTIDQLEPSQRSTNGFVLPEETSRPAAKQFVAVMHATAFSWPPVPPGPEGAG